MTLGLAVAEGELVELAYSLDTFVELPREEMFTGYSLHEGAAGEDGSL